MKKILFSMVCLMMVSIQSVQAQVAIAALHHEGNVTIYPASRIQTAIDNSVAGDTIYLSEGVFDGFTVSKPIAIIGAGQTTIISTGIDLGGRNNPIESGLLLSGLNIIHDVGFFGVINGARIMQCKINDGCYFEGNNASNIDIIMSQIETLEFTDNVKGLSVVASKISNISGGADEGSVTILNCNIARDDSYGITFMNCIMKNLSGSIYTNCLYININQADSDADTVIYDCYQHYFTLDNDLNCSLSDEQLKAAGYLGPNGTWVGITGGEEKFSLVTPVAQVVDHSLEVDQAERKLKVTLKLGNK